METERSRPLLSCPAVRYCGLPAVRARPREGSGYGEHMGYENVRSSDGRRDFPRRAYGEGMVTEEKRERKSQYQREYIARKREGIHLGVGRPRKVPLVRELKCIYCTQLLNDEYHIKYPCWKSKLNRYFDSAEADEVHF